MSRRPAEAGTTSAEVGPASARHLDTWPTQTEGPESGRITIWTDRFSRRPHQSMCTKQTAGGRLMAVVSLFSPAPQLVLNTSPAVSENCLSPLNAEVFKGTRQHLVLVMVVKKTELPWYINSWLMYVLLKYQ